MCLLSSFVSRSTSLSHLFFCVFHDQQMTHRIRSNVHTQITAINSFTMSYPDDGRFARPRTNAPLLECANDSRHEIPLGSNGRFLFNALKTQMLRSVQKLWKSLGKKCEL